MIYEIKKLGSHSSGAGGRQSWRQPSKAISQFGFYGQTYFFHGIGLFYVLAGAKMLEDPAKLVQAHEGIRGNVRDQELKDRIGHELSDCLWSVLVLAEEMGIDLESAYLRTMEELSDHLS